MIDILKEEIRKWKSTTTKFILEKVFEEKVLFLVGVFPSNQVYSLYCEVDISVLSQLAKKIK